MKDPIKIIHKFKNNNKRIQYKVYIFVGNIISEEIISCIELIKNKDFYDSLILLSNKQYNLLKEYYGERWYEKFFISYHIKSQRKIIENTPIKKKKLEQKYGKEWINSHISKNFVNRITYSYANYYIDNLMDKKRNKLVNKKPEMNFKTYFNEEKVNQMKGNKDIDNNDDDNEKLNQLGGDNDNDDEKLNQLGGDDDDDEIDIDIDEVNIDNQKKDVEIEEEDLDDMVEEDFNLEDIAKMYTEENNENNKMINETSKLISQAINDKKWEKQIERFGLDYDFKLDTLSYDLILEDVYDKYYIYDEYIFKDDTIKTLRQKISVTIPLSPVYHKELKFLPETLYFWSEYYNQNGKDEVMLGQKWIRKNELLKIDIKPNENLIVYEKLRNNLSYLKDSFGYKIKREDDETNIIRFYDEFITNNEIFMLDIYNELGINYNPDQESKKNLFDVYINIYFPLISYDKFENIADVLNSKPSTEKIISILQNLFINIKNDTKLEKEVYTVVEKSKNELGDFSSYFNNNYIIQTNIHVNVNDPKNITGTTSDIKYNLYRIFDNFIVNEEYPFIQYQTFDNQITYKFFTRTENLDNNEVMAKWFENSPYGISFKILSQNNKYIAINLHESGRIEYKITWKEDDKAIVDDIIKTYEYIRNLLKKINSENRKIKFIMPENEKFKYAFINSIQKFTIPEKFKINHNDLSEFSRLFFPYVSLVIEPKKRVSKKTEEVEKVSKYGTYLRYKRISKYDNRSKMHLRILYFLRNYEINDKELIDEISKQFNITHELTIKEIDFVRERYGMVIKKSSKMLKKLKSLPKSKPPGIGIDIQGRDRDKYKIRITGARNKEQLDEIISFMKVLIYLYCETYLYKKLKYQKLKEILKSLNKIASRRNKVVEIVDYEKNLNTVKIITAIDKKRLGFKPEKGQNQWTRSCQNSGNDKKRRPDLISGDNVDKLVKNGYKLDEKTGYYEKLVKITVKNKKHDVTIRAVKLPGENNTFNYYTCDPSENQDHFYIGFLSRGNNPNDLCMPCCFKKDQLVANNKEKKNYYLKCIDVNSNNQTNKELSTHLTLGDKVYILQETNKVQDSRFIYLPKYLDIFFNQLWDHDHRIKNHYLYESKSGYYFKYTIKHDKYNYLAAIASIFEKDINSIINLMVNFLMNDKNNIYFTYLNNGDIKETFKTKENYIEYIKTSNHLEYDIIGDLISLPGLVTKKGLYSFILEKNILVVKKFLEKDNIIERYYLDCLNYENNFMINEDRDYIVIIKDTTYYHPIYMVQKDEKKDKKINLIKYYGNNKQILELKNYSNNSCNNNMLNKIIGNYLLFCKNIILKIKNNIKKQYIDTRNKAKYLLLDNNLLLPVFPSGISYEFSFDTIDNISKLLNYSETIKELFKIEKILKMDYIPKLVFFDKKDKDKIRIVSIFLENELIIPVKSEYILEKDIKKLGIPIKFQPLVETIDKAIEEYNKNPVKIIDQRYIRVKQHLFKNEAYNIFRLEISLFLENNKNIKDNIISIVRNDNIKINDKKHELRKLLFNITNHKLAHKSYNVSKIESIGEISNDLPDLQNYIIDNLRDFCATNKNKNTCSTKPHCIWTNDSCKIQLTENLAIDFVNKIIEEFVQNNIQFKEIIQENNYYVSDIVDYSQYSFRANQKIIKTTNFNLHKIMTELFGIDKTPIIGIKQINRHNTNEQIIEDDYLELVELGKQLYQPIILNKDSIIRAFVNCYYWINNTLYDIESRNLGYFSKLQTILSNRFKAKIIDYIHNAKIENNDKYNKYISKYFNDDKNFFDSALNKFRKQPYNTDCKLELLILSFITDYRIVVYNNYSNVIYLFLQGQVELNETNIKNFTKEEYRNKTIFIKLDFDGTNIIPKNISSIYYK